MAVSNFEHGRRVAALPPSVSGTERLLMHTLLLHRNAQTGECFPTFATLAREMGASIRTVKYTVSRLAGAGMLAVGKRRTHDGKGNTYTLTIPEVGATVAPTSRPQTVQSATSSRCNPQPQTVQSATADGATVAPEQIREQGFTECVEQAHTHPTIEEVLSLARDAELPEHFARKWYADMEQAGWRDTRGNTICRRNARAVLAAWWRQEVRVAMNTGTNQQIGVIHHENGYVNPL